MPSPLPFGVTRIDTTTALTPPFTLGSQTELVAVAAGQAICGLDVGFTDLDAGTEPTLAFSFGTYAGASNLVSEVSAAETANVSVVEGFTPIAYASAGSLWMNVAAEAASAVDGTVITTHYLYPAIALADLRDRVLRKLGVLAQGEAPAAPDGARALEALEDLHLRLQGMELTRWGDPGISGAATEEYALTAFGQIEWSLDCVPRFAALSYSIMAASDLADVFGVGEARAGRLLQEAAGAERELRKLARVPTSGEPVMAVFY